MTKKAKDIGIAIGTSLIAGTTLAVGTYAVTKGANKCSNVTLVLSGNENPAAGEDETYTVLAEQNSAALVNVSITITENVTKALHVENTDSNGVATFNVNFPTAGTYALVASYQCGSSSIYSNSITVTVGGTGGGGCTEQTCPCGQVWDTVLCQCSSVIPAIIQMPAEPTFSENYIAATIDTGAKIYGEWGNCNAASQQPVLTISGKLVDSDGYGAGCQNLSAALSGLPYTFNGSGDSGSIQWQGYVDATISVSETDQDGNFTVSITPSVTVTSISASLMAIPPVFGGCYPPDASIPILMPVIVSFSPTVVGQCEVKMNLRVIINWSTDRLP